MLTLQVGRRSRCRRRTCSLDPAVGTADSANAIDWFEASPDGSLVAVGTSEGGSEHSVLRVLASDDGRDLGEAIPDTRACSVAWEPDRSGFAYTRYPEGDQYHRTVHHHVIGDRWQDDPVVWAEHPDPQAWPDVTMSPDGRWLLVHVLVGWARHRCPPPRPVDGGVAHADRGRRGDIAVRVQRRREVARRRHDRRGTAWTRRPYPARRAGRLGDDRRRGRRRAVPPRRVVRRSSRRRHLPRRRCHPPLRRRWASTRHVEGIGDVVAVAGLTADRDTGAAFAVVDSFAAPTALWRVDGDRTAVVRRSGRRRRRAVAFGEPGDVPVARRHVDRVVPDPPRRRHAGPGCAGDPQRLRRFRHRRDAGVVAADRRMVRGRRAVCDRRAAWWPGRG